MSCLLYTVFVYLFLLSNESISSKLEETKVRRERGDTNEGTCELPPYPNNGRWSILNGQGRPGEKISINSILKFECDSGYKLSSATSLSVCDKNWSLSKLPICEKKCPPKYSTPTTIIKCEDKHGREVSCEEAVDETFLSYECIPFYETPFGYRKTILCKDGTWNFPNPVCQPICGKKIEKSTVPLVVGGTINEQREYPWIIALYKKIGNEFTNICGGSLLSQRVIITAAHCVTNDFGDKLPTGDFAVGAGKYYKNYKDPRDKDAQYSEVARIVVMPGYKGPIQLFLADIAMLITKDLIPINKVIQPVCYQGLTNIHLQAGKVGVFAGWGITETGEQPDELRSLKIPFKHPLTCTEELPPDWANKFNTLDKICAGFFNQNKSVCTGDSGGGLMFKNPEDNRYYIHGIVSIAPAENGHCNPQQNSLYTKVAYYYDFVDKEVTKQYVEQCSLPPYPMNGIWTVPQQQRKPGDVVSSNTVLRMECNEGYVLIGPAVMDCQSSFARPKCELSCPTLTFPKGTTYKCTDKDKQEIDCKKAIHGTVLTYSCPQNYKPSPGGANVRYCKNGSWGQYKPECILENDIEQSSDVGDRKVVCTYASWYAFDKVLPENIDAFLCTHIIYSFATLWENGDVKVKNEAVELDNNNGGLYRKFTDLKKKNKNLKVLLSIGSTSGEDAALFARMAENEEKKAAFFKSVLSIIKTYDFDGINLEWFYPERKDKENYINLLSDFRTKVNEKGLLLTSTIRVYPEESGYSAEDMSKFLDWIVVRTYDFYGPWSPYIGQNSPLYASSAESAWEKEHLNIQASAEIWTRAGIPKSKLILSIAFYGRSFLLSSKDLNAIHSPFKGAGSEDGVMRYSQICTFKKWTTVFDDEQKSVYSYYGTDWVGYDNKDTVKIKAAYIKNNGYLGVNIWPLDGDDVFGKCGPKQILLKSVHAGLGKNVTLDD